MKIFLLLITLLSLLQAEHIRWYGSYDKARQEALKENKLLMVLLIEEECDLCQKMLRTTFINQPYINELNEKFVSVLITKGQKESYPIEMLYTMTYPSLFFLNSEELFVAENIFGYVNPEVFTKYLKLHVKSFNDAAHLQ